MLTNRLDHALRSEATLDVVVVGGVNTDYMVKAQHFPAPGATVQGSEFREAPGGKGANQAIAAARMGARVALVARVGNDARGRKALSELDQNHVDTKTVLEDSLAATGAALVVIGEAGDKLIVTDLGANQKLVEEQLLGVSDVLAQAKVVLIQLEIPTATAAAAARLGRAAGALVVLDPAPPVPLSEDFLRDVHVIRPNAHEAEELTGVEVRDRRSAKLAADNLLRRGVGAACIGARRGNLLAWADGELWLPHLPVSAVDKTGAGDAFAGVLSAMLAEGRSLEEAARYAHAAAALKTRTLGAQAGLPSRDELFAFVSELDSSA